MQIEFIKPVIVSNTITNACNTQMLQNNLLIGGTPYVLFILSTVNDYLNKTVCRTYCKDFVVCEQQ